MTHQLLWRYQACFSGSDDSPVTQPSLGPRCSPAKALTLTSTRDAGKLWEEPLKSPSIYLAYTPSWFLLRFVLVEGEAENEGDGTCRGRALRPGPRRAQRSLPAIAAMMCAALAM